MGITAFNRMRMKPKRCIFHQCPMEMPHCKCRSKARYTRSTQPNGIALVLRQLMS